MKRKATRKPITALARSWMKQAKWVVSYLERLPATPSAHGLKWTHKMIAHYGVKFDDLYKIAPRSCRKQAITYKSRVDRVRAWVKHID